MSQTQFTVASLLSAASTGIAVQTPTTHSDLGKLWVAAQSGSAIFLWRFASGLLAYSTANAKEKLADIGAGIGRSKTFICRALKAARAFPNAPTTETDAQAFSDMFYGNEAQTAARAAGTSATTAPASKVDTGKGFIRSGIRSCLKGGMSAAEILAYCQEQMVQAETAAQADPTDPADAVGTVKTDSAKKQAAARTQAKAAQNAQGARMTIAPPAQADQLAQVAHLLSSMGLTIAPAAQAAA